jgi:hypothetical protein
VFEDNPYVWDESAAAINLPMVDIIIKSHNQNGSKKMNLTNLESPASISITTDHLGISTILL